MISEDLEGATAEEVLGWAYATHKRVALVASFQAESSVLIDMACRIVASPEVLTLDTGRLPEETHALFDTVRERYPIRLRILAPNTSELQRMTSAHGANLFWQSVELRHECCEVRKVRPLASALRDYDAWITGLRREQSSNRANTPTVTRDGLHGGITKIAPLATWSKQDVWGYIDEHGVATHELYERGYTSIGCAPCTRATSPGEDERAGRWWWEHDSDKECGLHGAMLEAVV